ncbi:MAG: DnaJ domain-containing protein [Acidobacteriota bacterium]
MTIEGSDDSRHKLLAQMLGRSLDDRLRLDPRHALPSDSAERELLALFDGKRTLGDVFRESGLEAPRVQRLLQKLRVLGVLIPASVGVADRPAPLAESERAAIEAEHARMQTCNFYELLGVARSASGQDVQRAYDRVARQFRPDAFVDRDLGDALPMLQAIATKHLEAYDTLIDQKSRRKAYDESLAPESKATKDAKKEFEKGLRHFRRKDFEKAIPHFQTALDLEPDNAQYKDKLARAKRILESTDEL